MELHLTDFRGYLQSEGYRMTTREGYVGDVARFLKWLENQKLQSTEVTYTDLIAYVHVLKSKGNTTRTLNANINSIKRYYNYLQANEQLSYSPVEELHIKGEIRKIPHNLLEWEELEKLYKDYPSKGLASQRNKVMLSFIVYQGLNSGEIDALELTDIKLEEATIYIPESGKRNSRMLELQAHQIMYIQQYILQVRPMLLAITGKQTDKLFVSLGSGNTMRNSIQSLMVALRKNNTKVRDGLQIRASVITHWISKYNLRQAQYMAGHRYASSTERYQTNNLDLLQDQIDELHPLSDSYTATAQA